MWYNKYIGIPYQEKGRSETGVDCWGLVKLVYEKDFNILVPGFTDSYEHQDTERIEELIAQ